MRADCIVVQVDHANDIASGSIVPDQLMTSRVAAKLTAGSIEDNTGT